MKKPARKTSTRARSGRGLVVIGAYRVLEGVLLVAAGVGALHLLRGDYEATLLHWVHVLRIDPDNHYIHATLVRIFSMDPHKLRELSAGTFIYAGLRFVEGFGLMARKRWAEWLTVIATAVFIPLEVWEMARRFTYVRVGFFVINVLVVAYLIWSIRTRR